MKLLHISDIHMQATSTEGYRDTIQVALLEAVAQLTFDVLVFSGDLGDKGQKPEYQTLGPYLDSLAQGRPVVVVPGNHDVDRTRADTSALFSAWPTKAHYLLHRDKVLAPERFDAFSDFASGHPLDWRANIAIATTVVNGATFIGINTALLAHSASDEGKLAVDYDGLERALAGAQSDSLVVAVGHHPISWLVPWNEKEVRQALSRSRRGAHLFLHGHLHYPSAEAITSSKGQRLAPIQAGAAYQGSGWETSFWHLELDREGRRLSPTLYRFSQDTGRFDVDGARSQPMICDLGEVAVTATRPGAPTPLLTPDPRRDRELPRTARALIDLLEGEFETVWEPGGITGAGIDAVFWPVRLRRPTLIHAAQAFIAGSFQICGARIKLCLDTFGNTGPSTVPIFTDRMRRHFDSIGADWSAVDVEQSQVLLTEDRLARTWDILSNWLTRVDRLELVLTVCKLLAEDLRDLNDALGKKPRRLMTPAVVWACLQHAMTGQPETNGHPTRWMTLGGNDERPLWRAWRDVMGLGARVGHLYLPELANLSNRGQGNVAMGDIDLFWESGADILKTLNEDDAKPSDSRHVLGWLLKQCIVLPAVIRGQAVQIDGATVDRPADLELLDGRSLSRVRQEVAQLARSVLL